MNPMIKHPQRGVEVLIVTHGGQRFVKIVAPDRLLHLTRDEAMKLADLLMRAATAIVDGDSEPT